MRKTTLVLQKTCYQGIHTTHKSEPYGKFSNQVVFLLMIVDSKNRHYTAIKNLSRLPKSLKAIRKGADHFCMNSLNGFSTATVRDQLYEYNNSNCHVKVKIPWNGKTPLRKKNIWNFTMVSISSRFHFHYRQTSKAY